MPNPIRRGSGPKVIAVTGSTGLVGKQLVKALEADGMRSLPYAQHGAATWMPVEWGSALHSVVRLNQVLGPESRKPSAAQDFSPCHASIPIASPTHANRYL